MLVDLERTDAHPADVHGLTRKAEVSDDLLLSTLLETVLTPFLSSAPGAVWICRARSNGEWRDIAEVVTSGPQPRRGARLLVHDETVRSFAGADADSLRVACRDQLGGT